MIIFDLDGVLADCKHRLHFIQPNECRGFTDLYEYELATDRWFDKYDGHVWKPDWKSFYEACDQDIPICPVINIYNELRYLKSIGLVKIWSGRSELAKEKTEEWLNKNDIYFDDLKMRPIGDSTPEDVLKETWLEEALQKRHIVDYAFDANPESIRMWRRRGIFVFDVNQQF